MIVEDLGLIEYKNAWEYQENIFTNTINNKIGNLPTTNYLLLCEHQPVYTIGRSGNFSNLLINKQELKEKKISFYKTNRGGDITFHGPGQIVGYPIVNLTDLSIGLKKYITIIEEIIIKILAKYTIIGERLDGSTGVWIDTNFPERTRKICAIGVRSSRYITMHGFALNVYTNLEYFNYINPCGFTNKKVTSIEKEINRKIEIEEIKNELKIQFLKYFR